MRVIRWLWNSNLFFGGWLLAAGLGDVAYRHYIVGAVLMSVGLFAVRVAWRVGESR